MKEQIQVMISEERVNARIAEIAAEINEDYKGEELLVIGILRGGVYFCTELTKRITAPLVLDFIEASSYGSGTQSGGQVQITKDLIEDIAGKHVIVVEDIVDTGRTLSRLLEKLRARGPKSLRLCVLLDKPDRRVVEVKVDYKGFEIPNRFVVGYGMDYAQKYRNLPYIGVVEDE